MTASVVPLRVVFAVAVIAAIAAIAACGGERDTPAPAPVAATSAEELRLPREEHLANVRQLTFDGENAEGYWSADGTTLIFQRKAPGMGCDQIFVMDVASGEFRRVSSGEGATTCGYFFPDGKRILYSSTVAAGPDCPPPPDYSKGYVWKLHPEYDIYTADPDGGSLVRLTDNPDYDAEATIATDGSRILFTSLRDGDLDLYTMNPDGSGVTRITRELGYDGGGFFSRDGRRIVWRASRPTTPEEIRDYRELLAEHQIRPMVLEIWVANADGSDPVQVTRAGAASFAPYFFPDGKRIIFSSNMADPRGRDFDLWMVNDDGSGLERVTFNDTFDGFPMFSPDGTRLAFASNRHNAKKGDTNLFVADWIE